MPRKRDLELFSKGELTSRTSPIESLTTTACGQPEAPATMANGSCPLISSVRANHQKLTLMLADGQGSSTGPRVIIFDLSGFRSGLAVFRKTPRNPFPVKS